VGACPLCVGAAPGVVIEANRIFKRAGIMGGGISMPAHVGGETSVGDDVDRDAIVRNNVFCYATAGAATVAVNVPGAQVTNNVVRTGADATTGACAR